MSAPPNPVSSVDMLRLEYPPSVTEIYNGVTAPEPTLDIQEPPAWLHILVTQQQQAQWDLEQLYTLCGSTYDRANSRIRRIEQTYGQMRQAIEYVYARMKDNTHTSNEWIRTELMHVANASRQFSSNVWSEIFRRNQDKVNEDTNWDTRILHIQDGIQFRQTANQQRLEEQAVWNDCFESWAVNQQAATARLAQQQQALQAQKSDLITDTAKKGKGKGKAKAQPTFLQSAAAMGSGPLSLPPSISSLVGLAPRSPTPGPTPPGAGGAGGAPPPPPPPGPAGGHTSHPPSALPPLPPSPGPLPRSRSASLRGARMVALTYEELQAIIQTTVHGTQATLGLGSTSVAMLKLKDPKEFDGKPTTHFTLGWESVQEYSGSYPQATDA